MKTHHWCVAPSLNLTASTEHEVLLAIFFNQVLDCAKKACSTVAYRAWDGSSAMCPLKGGDLTRKPGISCWFPESEFNWRHLVISTKVKNHTGKPNEKSSYIEVARKASCLLYTQDGCHFASCIHILNSQIYLTIFDHGGSLSTCGYNINLCSCSFLHILSSMMAIWFN
ncbi:hypothetical protein V8B97DRAFT_2026409 [Scleroderma yunnanense]